MQLVHNPMAPSTSASKGRKLKGKTKHVKNKRLKRMDSAVMRDRLALVQFEQKATGSVGSARLSQTGRGRNRSLSVLEQDSQKTSGFSLRRNSADVQDTSQKSIFETIAESKKKHKCLGILPIISPLSVGHSVWDLFMSFILAVSVISLPLGMAFEDNSENNFFVLNVTIDCLFIIDIFVTFITGYVNSNDILVMDSKQIAIHYMKTWFIVDIIASFPLDPILVSIEANENADSNDAKVTNLVKSVRVLRLLRMAKLFRLLRLSRVSKYFTMARVYLQHTLRCSVPMGLLKLLKLFFLLLFAGHWLGCMFYMFASLYDFPYNSWVVTSGLDTATLTDKYGWSLFKALYLMIGGEEMLPTGLGPGCDDLSEWCRTESWLTLVCLYIGAIFMALLISEVGQILSSNDRARRNFHDNVRQVNDYMRAKKLSPALREGVRQYFEVRYHDQKMFDESHILQSLSPNLRTRIHEEVCVSLIQRVPVLHDNVNCHSFIDCLVDNLGPPLFFFPGEVVFYSHTPGDAIYFIFSGVVSILSKSGRADPEASMQLNENNENNENGDIVAALSNGCYFGDVAVLCGVNRTATAQAEAVTILHSVSRAGLIRALEGNENLKKYMEKIAKKRHQRVKQIDPYYDGPIDESLESDDYVDEEDAKTDLIKYQQKSAVSRSGNAFGFSRDGAHLTEQEIKLQKLRRNSNKYVQSTKKVRRESQPASQLLTETLKEINHSFEDDGISAFGIPPGISAENNNPGKQHLDLKEPKSNPTPISSTRTDEQSSRTRLSVHDMNMMATFFESPSSEQNQ